jgi:hypothetical protein
MKRDSSTARLAKHAYGNHICGHEPKRSTALLVARSDGRLALSLATLGCLRSSSRGALSFLCTTVWAHGRVAVSFTSGEKSATGVSPANFHFVVLNLARAGGFFARIKESHAVAAKGTNDPFRLSLWTHDRARKRLTVLTEYLYR